MFYNTKKYFRHLFIALLGRNPFRVELEQVTHEYEQTAAKVRHLDELRYTLEQKVAEETAKVHQFENLTENQRQRLTDKDITIDAMTKEHRERMAQVQKDYTAKVEELKVAHARELREQQERFERDRVDRHEEYEERMSERDAKIQALREDLDGTLEQLQKANKTLAHECLAQAMLDKTNNALDDLYAAMQSGEEEKVKAVVEYLDWSNHLARIAQQHLMVLRRKNELVERLHFMPEACDDDNVNHE